MVNKITILALGNVYVETNYIGLNTAGSDTLEAGKEYRASSYETRLGGSVMYFAQESKILGADVGLIGKIGNDESGNKLLSLLKEVGISSDFIVRSNKVQTSVDTGVILEHNARNIQFVSGNANQNLAIEDINLNNPFINEVKALYVGGVLKQTSLLIDYPKMLSDFSSKGIKIFLDHGRIPVDITEENRNLLTESLKFVEGYFPNENELLGITNRNNLEEALFVALKWGPKFVAVKLGEKGCLVADNNKSYKIPGHKVNAVNSVGAGDTFNATFTINYLKEKNLEECALIANAAAAVRVSRNTLPNEKEILEFIKLHQI